MSEIDLKPKTNLLQWSDEDVVKILKQYDRKPADLKADVATIRKWLITQPHLPLQPINCSSEEFGNVIGDRQIVFFLLLNKFSFEKTKTKLEMYYSIKSILPEFFALSPSDPNFEESMNAYNGIPLVQLSEQCNRIMISKCQYPDKVNVCNLINYIALLFELLAIYDFSSSHDFILDMENVNISLISKFNIVEIKKAVSIWENVYSARINAVHVIHMPNFAVNLLNFSLTLLKEKIQKRVYIHKSVEELWEFYPKDILPKEMGGTKPLEEMNKEWLGFFRENNEYLEKMRKLRIAEDLRPQKLVNDETLGYHGNFRKLEID